MSTAIKSILVVIAVAAVALGAWFLVAKPPAAVSPAGQVVQLDGPTMGGDWKVRLGKPVDEAKARSLTVAVQAVLDRVDGQMSTWKPASDLSKFNASAETGWVAVPPELAACVAEAQTVSRQTGGAFDVTVGPLVNLWGFGPRLGKPATAPGAGAAAAGAASRPGSGTPQVPSDAAIAVARQKVGYRQLEVRLDPPALRKARADSYVDLSGIAQGYAADLVADRLAALGVADYLVDVCGEIRAAGFSGKDRPWRVGLQEPTADSHRVLRGVVLRDVSLATSGDYQIFFELDGVRYCHEIDPRTGRPIPEGLASVSVAHPSAAYADAMATALMVLGPTAGYDLCMKLDLAAFFVTRRAGRFETRATPAFERVLVSAATSRSAVNP